jgi:hypothetical protein
MSIRLVFAMTKITIKLPFFATRTLRRVAALGRGAMQLVTHDDVVCGHCGASQGLTARWRCKKCGYVWMGHGFSRCPLCLEKCLFLNCQSCGTSIRNPLP